VASVILTLARSTNMDKRLRVWANKSRLKTNKIVSGAVLTTIKLACMRPLAEQKAAKRD
jgi:hypothetical protein